MGSMTVAYNKTGYRYHYCSRVPAVQHNPPVSGYLAVAHVTWASGFGPEPRRLVRLLLDGWKDFAALGLVVEHERSLLTTREGSS